MLVQDFGLFAASTRFEDLPKDVCEAVKFRVLDTFGAALAGFHLGLHEPLATVIRSCGDATIWGAGWRYAPRDASLLNSFLAHCCYIEDGSRHTGGHPSSVVIPSAFVLAETNAATGRDLIAAVAVGYEVFLRLGRTIYPAVVKRGFQSTAVLGAVSSAAACGSILRLDATAASHALGIACNLGVGLKEALKSSASQPLQVARSCEAGHLSALYAAAGAEGAKTIVENGFFPAFAGNVSDQTATNELGARFRISETYVKIHGGCRGNHAPVDAVRAIVANNGLRAEVIDHIDVAIDSVTYAGEIHNPTTGSQAQFSVAFAVAVAIVEGDASVLQYTNEKLSQKAIQSLMQRVRVSVDPALDAGYPDKRGAHVAITLRNGRRYAHHLDNARGEPEDPLSTADIRKKFMTIADQVLGVGADRVCDRILNLENLDSIDELARMFFAPLNAHRLPLDGPSMRKGET